MNQEKLLYKAKLKNIIGWISCDIKPKDGEEIWVLSWHSKGHFPSSFRIFAGEVETGSDGSWRVNTCDYDGGGSNCYYPNVYDDGFKFWCYKWEISIPEDLISWDHDPGTN